MLRGKEILDAIISREVPVCLVSIVLQCLKADFFYLWNFNFYIIIPISPLFIFFTIYKPVKFHQIFVWLINCSPTLVTSYKSFIFSLKGEQNNRYTSNKYTNTKLRLILKYIYVHTNLYLAINIGIDVKRCVLSNWRISFFVSVSVFTCEYLNL